MAADRHHGRGLRSPGTLPPLLRVGAPVLWRRAGTDDTAPSAHAVIRRAQWATRARGVWPVLLWPKKFFPDAAGRAEICGKRQRPVFMHRPFVSGRSPLKKIPLVRLWEDEAEGGKEGRPGCSLLEKVFQRFALQVVPSDIFLVVFAKSLRREEQDMFRFVGKMAFI